MLEFLIGTAAFIFIWDWLTSVEKGEPK